MDVASKTAEDVEKRLESLEKENAENNVETLKVECKVNEERSPFETDKINDLEGKIISAESRLLSIEKESVDLAHRLENIEKCAKVEDKDLDDLRKQLVKGGTLENTEERFSKLEEFNRDLKQKFINLLEVCEGFQSELEEIKNNNILPKKPSEENTFEGSRFPPPLCPNPIVRSPDVPVNHSANTVPLSKPLAVTFNQSKSVVEQFQSQFNVYVHNTTASSTQLNGPTTTSLFPLYNWKFPVDHQVVFGPIPASADHNVFYQTIRSAFQKMGQVCNMFLSQTVQSDPATGDLVKFGYVVFRDKQSAEKAAKIGRIVMPGGCEVLLKEVPKPWLAS